MTLNSKIALQIAATLDSGLDLANASSPLNLDAIIRLASGTTANKADRIFHDRRTLLASATEDLDLAAGGLLDPLNVALTMARLKVLVVKASSANVNNVNVIRPASNGVPLFLAAGDGIPVTPGGFFAFAAPNAAGIVVTPGTGDLITFTNSAAGTAVTFDVVAIGTSA
jgi:hypothetical protein